MRRQEPFDCVAERLCGGVPQFETRLPANDEEPRMLSVVVASPPTFGTKIAPPPVVLPPRLEATLPLNVEFAITMVASTDGKLAYTAPPPALPALSVPMPTARFPINVQFEIVMAAGSSCSCPPVTLIIKAPPVAPAVCRVQFENVLLLNVADARKGTVNDTALLTMLAWFAKTQDVTWTAAGAARVASGAEIATAPPSAPVIVTCDIAMDIPCN